MWFARWSREWKLTLTAKIKWWLKISGLLILMENENEAIAVDNWAIGRSINIHRIIWGTVTISRYTLHIQCLSDNCQILFKQIFTILRKDSTFCRCFNSKTTTFPDWIFYFITNQLPQNYTYECLYYKAGKQRFVFTDMESTARMLSNC